MDEESPRSQQIDWIVERNQDRFNAWLQTNKKTSVTAIPFDVLPILVPRRVYELSQNPSNIEVIPSQSPTWPKGQSILRFVTMEHMDIPVTDPAVWKKYKQDLEVTTDANFQPFIGKEGVDEMHWELRQDIEAGTLRLNDKVVSFMELWQFPKYPQTLWVAQLTVNPRLRKQHIARDIYHDLYKIAQILGYRFVAGYNRQNVKVIFQKLGRVFQSQIKPEKRGEIITDPSIFDFSVEFLNPEDKKEFLLPGSETAT